MKAYVDSLPTCGRRAELAGSLQRLQHDAQALVLDRKAIAKLGTRQHRAVGQKIKDLLLETASPFRPELGNDLQMVVSALVATSSRSTGDSSRRSRVIQQQDRDVELPLQLNPSPLPTPLLTSYVAGMTSGAAE